MLAHWILAIDRVEVHMRACLVNGGVLTLC